MEEKLLVRNSDQNKEDQRSKLSFKGEDPLSTNFFSKIFFHYAYRLIKLANRTQLKQPDLGNPKGKNSASEYIPSFEKPKKNSSILKALITHHICSLIFIIFLDLSKTIAEIAQIVLFRSFIKTIPTGTQEEVVVLGAKFVLVKLGEILISKSCDKLQYIFAYKCANEVNYLIYDKVLKLSFTSRKSKSIAEIINYIQVDVQKMIMMLSTFTTIIHVPLLFIGYSFFLFRCMGFSFIFGFGTVLVLMMINLRLQRIMKMSQRDRQQTLDKRMKLTTECLNNIKNLKLYSWDNFFLKKIIESRDVELGALKRTFSVANKIRTLLWLSPILGSVSSIGAYIYFVPDYKIENIFTVISIFTILQDPLRAFGNVSMTTVEMTVSLKRIQAFLSLDEVEKHDKRAENPQGNSFDIKIEKGNFSSDKNSGFKLTSIDLEVKPGEFVIITGEVGSGKTMLLNAIMNNITKETATNVKVRGSLGYVSQVPWLMKGTIKENILFFDTYDGERMREAIEASGLKEDFDNNILNEDTNVGENGSNLSGGQKARVCIARAVYASRDIYLFDDILASLDANTAKTVVENCISGVLKNKTRLLVTNSLQFLHLASRVLYIEKGAIKYFDTYENLKSKNLLDNITKGLSKNDPEIAKVEESERPSNKGSAPPVQGPKAPNKPQIPNEKVILKEYIKGIGGGKTLFFILVIVLIWQLLRSVSDVWLSLWVKEAKKLEYFIVYAGLGIVSSMFLYCRLIYISKKTVNSSLELHKEMISKIIFAPLPEYHFKTDTSQMVNQLSKDLTTVDFFASVMFGNTMSFGGTFISSILICSVFQPVLLVFIPLLLFLSILFMKFYLKGSRQLAKLESESRNPIISTVREASSGSDIIRVFQKEKKFNEIFMKKLDNFFVANILVVSMSNWFSLILDIFSLFFKISLVSLMIYFREKIPNEVMALMLAYSFQLENTLSRFVFALSTFSNTLMAYNRCIAYRKVPQERLREVTNTDSKLISWPKLGTIRFDNFSTKYSTSSEDVLKSINLSISKGEKIGICGRTGGGKTTLAMSLFRILEASSGSISIDDVDISTMGLNKLRSNITMIPQENFILNGTIRYNIDPIGAYSDEMLREAITSIGWNKDINLDSDKSSLSTGEKQMIAIVRAIMRHSKIIVMDESTSSIDVNNEEKIIEGINKTFSKSTVIIIAHRIKTIMKCDRVCVVDNGKIAECDTPENLLKDRQSLFYKLYANSKA